jgi:hypothetical protein
VTGRADALAGVTGLVAVVEGDARDRARAEQAIAGQFALESGELRLAFPGQRCFNKVIGSEYQMDRWTVTVTGNQEHEYIQATSFLPSGTFNFALARGARMRAGQRSRHDAAKNYAGHWIFSLANPATGVNIETVVSAAGQESQSWLASRRVTFPITHPRPTASGPWPPAAAAPTRS